MVNANFAKGSILLTTADIQRWKNDVTRIDQEIRDLEARRDDIKARLTAAAFFLSPQQERPGQGALTMFAPVGDPFEGVAEDANWPLIIEACVCFRGRTTFSSLREDVINSIFGNRFNSSEKGYYHALSRLSEKAKIIKHKGYLFSPQAFETFMKAVEDGLATDDEAPSDKPSPMAEAIIGIVSRYPGLTSPEVISELKKDTEFAAVLTPHVTGAYNVMARLVRRRQLSKSEGGYYLGPVKAATSP